MHLMISLNSYLPFILMCSHKIKDEYVSIVQTLRRSTIISHGYRDNKSGLVKSEFENN